VVTQPDRPSGRGYKLQATPVKLAAQKLGIATIEPLRMRDALETVRAESPDVFAVASYGKILPQSLLDVPSRGALNVHPSLLPLYRGATPLQSQLRDGVTESGVTIIFMDAGMDTGDIVLVERTAIGPTETYGELHDRLARLGAELLGRACTLVAAGTAPRISQTGLASEAEIERTITRPIDKAGLLVDWAWPARRIVDHVRSLAPAPGARAHLATGGDPSPSLEQEVVKLLNVRVAAGYETGELVVPCGVGEFVAIELLVPPSRKAMTGRAYVTSRASALHVAR